MLTIIRKASSSSKRILPRTKFNFGKLTKQISRLQVNNDAEENENRRKPVMIRLPEKMHYDEESDMRDKKYRKLKNFNSSHNITDKVFVRGSKYRNSINEDKDAVQFIKSATKSSISDDIETDLESLYFSDNYGEGKTDRSIQDEHYVMKNISNNTEIIYGIYPVLYALNNIYRQSYKLHVKYKAAFNNNLLLDIVSKCRQLDIPVTYVNNSAIDKLIGVNKLHQGVCLETSFLPTLYVDKSDIINNKQNDSCNESSICLETNDVNSIIEPEKTQRATTELWLYLDQIRDPMNLGAIIRSAYYFGVNKIIVPSENSCAVTPTVSKASSGVSEILMLHKVKDTIEMLNTMKQSNKWKIICTAANKKLNSKEMPCIPIQDLQITEQNVLLVLGNEGTGVSSAIEDQCDIAVSVLGDSSQTNLDSLNVSVANGILLHSLFTKLRG